ncbi:MAG: LamG domain-containing protein [Akkermansiaceae bacterium]|nr:LamG domain-containing protein [Akkermansiaceae bacterium]
MPRKFLLLVLGTALAATPISYADLNDVLGIWQFDNDLTEADGGTSLTANGFVPEYLITQIDGTDVTVLDLAPLDPAQTLALTNTAGANGGDAAAHTNNWTLVMDINLESISTFQSLVQTNPANSNDVDIFVRPGGELSFGSNLTEAGALAPDTWYRLAFTCGNDGAGGGLRCTAYVDGVQTAIGGAPQTGVSGFEGVFSLDTIVNLFSDESSETDDMMVNSIAFWGEELAPEEIALLGAVSTEGITIPEEEPKICPSLPAATVSVGLPNPTIDLSWRGAQGLDSTGIDLSLDGNLIGNTAPDATTFTHSPTVTPNGGTITLVYSIQMTGGADSANCDPIDVSVSFFTGSLETDLVAYLPLDVDGSDSSGRNHNGTVNGAPSFATGSIGNAVTLTDPVSPHEYIFIGATDDLNFGTDIDFSVSLWVNNSTGFPDNRGEGGSGSDPSIISNKDWNSGANSGWIIAAGPNGRWQWNINGDTGRRVDYDGPQNQISDGNWHHLLVSHDRDGNAVMYYDGQSVATRPISGIGNVNSAGYGVGIGTDGAESVGFPSWFPGSIDEVAIWRRVVYPSEVNELYQMGLSGTPLISNRELAITEIIHDSTGEVSLTFDSIPRAIYSVDQSGDLKTWLEIGDNYTSQGDSTTLTFTNLGLPFGTKQQFFRIRLP